MTECRLNRSCMKVWPLRAHIVAVPWVRRLVADISPRRPGYAVHVRFVVDKVSLRQFSPSSSDLPCQYHSTTDLHTYISSGG
jgi:hypothetical protein